MSPWTSHLSCPFFKSHFPPCNTWAAGRLPETSYSPGSREQLKSRVTWLTHQKFISFPEGPVSSLHAVLHHSQHGLSHHGAKLLCNLLLHSLSHQQQRESSEGHSSEVTPAPPVTSHRAQPSPCRHLKQKEGQETLFIPGCHVPDENRETNGRPFHSRTVTGS